MSKCNTRTLWMSYRLHITHIHDGESKIYRIFDREIVKSEKETCLANTRYDMITRSQCHGITYNYTRSYLKLPLIYDDRRKSSEIIWNLSLRLTAIYFAVCKFFRFAKWIST